jgi:hypothetical protein
LPATFAQTTEEQIENKHANMHLGRPEKGDVNNTGGSSLAMVL